MSVPTAIRRASSEKVDVQADPTATSGKADTAGRDERRRRPVAAPGYYRRGRNAQQAVIEVEELLFRGHPEVVDADLADYFGSIPHAELLKSVSRRIVDRRVLHLIRMWLGRVDEFDQAKAGGEADD